MAKNIFTLFITSMIVNNVKAYTPNFTAHRVGKAQVLEKNKSGEYEPVNVSIAELDVNDENDMETLKAISNKWKDEYKIYDQGYFYSDRIYTAAIREREDVLDSDYTSIHFYVMTKQNTKFKKLDVEKILAQTDIYDTEGVEDAFVEFLQVRPKYQYSEKNDRDIKEVGKTFLKKIFGDIIEKNGVLYPDHISAGFYKAIGLKKDEDGYFYTNLCEEI